MENTGVIVVDVQGDFTQLKSGSLAVEQTGQDYIDAVDTVTRQFKTAGLNIFATQDWHPKTHVSFFTNSPGKKVFEAIEINGRTQVLWPPHCVQGTDNADILLDETLFTAIVQKGTHNDHDSYSGFQDDGGKETDLDRLLKDHHVENLIIYGLATDYCVHATAMDALERGYRVVVIETLCKGVAPETTRAAVEDMIQKGIKITDHTDLESIRQLFGEN